MFPSRRATPSGSGDYAPIAANVSGTRHVIEAAAQAGSSRIIDTSTFRCIGVPQPGPGRAFPTDEHTPVSEAQKNNHYKLSKWQPEQATLELAQEGLPVVIVNPSAPVHVRDMAIGHILAAELVRVGERYILGHAEGKWSMRKTFSVLEEVSGVRAPRLRIPHWLALTAAHLDESLYRMNGHSPKVLLAGVRMARYEMFFNPAKAIRETGPAPVFAPADVPRHGGMVRSHRIRRRRE